MTQHSDIAVVAIGRNEGARLLECLTSLMGQAAPVVYVDSGSTDGSVAAARALGADVVELDMSQPFTAARARNAGYERVRALAPDGPYVQFLDGDCTLDADWLATGKAALQAGETVAVVCGRRREKFPEATFWNRLTDDEWDGPAGEVRACGGDALMRRRAVDAVQGYREDLIAGEEPEMCFRMRGQGWTIQRLDAEMTRHDAAMTRLSQWWQRCRRAGHTYAEGAAIHGRSPERYKVTELRRTLFWALVLPALIVFGTWLVSPWALLGLLAYPAQILRLTRQGRPTAFATCLVFGKFPEAQGVIGYWAGRILGRRKTLIEYK
ncbi:glycosyltransferase [Octadecabacter sp. 1_MG-2023]|uniref:glycosyltransferase n=1 Tax=unclassified Octadecabacter TaxID=196158 RepID=UPI001C09B03F|nr:MULTISPECIES: glycosyltransferase [unclassified Octadecabacter]MBU2994049.1 glycosyltransferase [Octadecabacter sp. B2R22]MDO6736097.1 glycosyltransferase [Octadecabacter sp. 1_MG-2023]